MVAVLSRLTGILLSRERSRGFDIKDIRKDGPSKVNLAAIEFSPDFRLKLFNAILILTYALPDNGTVSC